jgi:putative transposase
VAQPRYLWRKLTAEQQIELLEWRQKNRRPWHGPPHRASRGRAHFHLSAACYNHAPHIGHSAGRLDSFSSSLLEVLTQYSLRTVAWCVLPNHYHALVETDDILGLLRQLGLFHGRTSYAWNNEEGTRGRKVFHRATERVVRSDRHFFATLNYIHHNPVHHGYVSRWTDWRWSSAEDYISSVGRLEAERIWRAYPVLGYGAKWDPGDL